MKNDIFTVFNYNRSASFLLNRQQITQLIKSSDLQIVDKAGENALMHAIKNNNRNARLQLSARQMWYLLRRSNLRLKNHEGYTALMLVLIYNCVLSVSQWRYLLDNSEINYISPDSTALKIALVHECSKNYVNDLIKKTDLLHVQSEGDTYFMPLVIYETREKIQYNIKYMVRIIIDAQHENTPVLHNALSVMLDNENFFNMVFVYVKDKKWLINYLLHIKDTYLKKQFEKMKTYNIVQQYISINERTVLAKKIRTHKNKNIYKI